MSGLDIDFSKITVISTEKKNQSSVVFPEEGWFVGAENACMGSDHFGYRYLYFPKFTTHTQNSWEVILIRKEPNGGHLTILTQVSVQISSISVQIGKLQINLQNFLTAFHQKTSQDLILIL